MVLQLQTLSLKHHMLHLVVNGQLQIPFYPHMIEEFKVKNITISLDVGDDSMLKSFFNKDTAMTHIPDEIKRDEP